MSDVLGRIAALSPEQRARLESRVAASATARPAGSRDAISPRDRQCPTPLSFAQQREWAVEQFRPSNNITGALRLEGEADLDVFSRVLAEIVSRHEVLRTTIAMGDGGPVQQVHPPEPVPVPVVDLTSLDPADQRREVRRRADEEVTRTFPREQVLRLRATALRLGPREHVLLVTLDHAAADAWSLMILLGEVGALYPALLVGAGNPLPALPFQYGDFAVWQRDRASGERLDAEIAHWTAVLEGAPPRLALPTDRAPSARRSFAGDHLTQFLSGGPTAKLQQFARDEGASLSMVVLAVCSVVLHRYTDQDDLVFGSAVGARPRPETEQLIGCFANALPLRMRLTRDATLREVLHQAREVVSTAFDHQDVDFDRLVEELAPQEAGQTPLVQMMINVLSAPLPTAGGRPGLDLPGLRVTPVPTDPGPITVDLVLVVQSGPDSVEFDWHYSTELFDRATVERLADQVRHVMQRLVEEPDLRVGDVGLLGAEPAPPDRSPGLRPGSALLGTATIDEPGVVELMRRQAQRSPDAPAVVCDGEVITFAELVAAAHRVAHRLRGLQVGPETPVGILVDRGTLLPTAVLGVLAAGAAFLPLDVAYPPERIRQLLIDAGAPVLLTTAELAPTVAGLDGVSVVPLDPARPCAGEPETAPDGVAAGTCAAYVIYTSGSSGTPKGVVVEHRSLVTFAREVAERLQLGAGDRFLQFASPGFDVLVEELFPVWVAGGAVVVPSDDPGRSGTDLVELVARERITVMELPAAYWHEWVRQLHRSGRQLPPTLRLVVVGAERVLPERLAMWQPLGVPLEHVYGITETTVSSTFFRLGRNAPEDDLRHLPIGTALPSADLRLLDAELRPVPDGAVGELYIGGVSVARGYLGRPGLTAERFVADPDPSRPGERLYRTGDVVRTRADGNLEFFSRADSQIKIRGYRVESAEIESALCRHPQVTQAVVSVYEAAPGDRRLVAHLVTADTADPDVGELRRFLARELPPYLVPAAFVRVEEIPLTPNGKVDHDRLVAPGPDRPAVAAPFAAPSSPLERRLADIVAAVLGIDEVGVDDDFFELGGDSILAIMTVSRAQEEGIALSPLDIFEHRTVAQLARAATESEAPRAVPRRPADAEPALSFDQERLWLEDRLVAGAAYNVGWRYRLGGPLDRAVLEASIRVILQRHESLRTRFPTTDDGQPIQVVGDVEDSWQLSVHDLRHLGDGAEAAGLRLLDADVVTGFDLARGPMVRCLLVRVADEQHLLSFITHHIVADMASMDVFVRELAALYLAGADPVAAGLPELPVQYLDYAVWQRTQLQGDELDRQVSYWRRHLTGAPRALALPAARHTPSPEPQGGRIRAWLSAEDTTTLRAFCREHDVTTFMVVTSVLSTVLSRWAGQQDVVLGVSVSSRTNAGTENLIGSFINTLPLRVDLAGEPTFAELLDRVRKVALGGYAHADAPLDLVVKHLRVTRGARQTPLFQVMLNVVHLLPTDRIGDVSVAMIEPPPAAPSFDLVFTVHDVGEVMLYTLEYDAARYDADLMQVLAGQLGGLLGAVLADPSRHVLDYPLHDPPSRDPVDGARASGCAGADGALRHQARRRPDTVAALDAERSWTYRALDEAADRMARRVTDAGGERVAVVRRPSVAVVAALAGCLRAGATPVLLDAAAASRAAGQGVGLVLDVHDTTVGDDPVPACQFSAVPLPAGPVPPGPVPAGPAEAVACAQDWAVARFGFHDGDRFAVLTGHPGQHLAAVTAAMHAGGAIVVPPAPTAGRQVADLVEWLDRHRVSVLYLNPPLARALAGQVGGALPALRHVFVESRGDLLSRDVDALGTALAGCRWVATYRSGPDGRPLASYVPPDDWSLESAPWRVPLGHETREGSLRLRHPGGSPAAVGEVAQLWNGEEPTGDLARRWPDGTLEFVGSTEQSSERTAS